MAAVLLAVTAVGLPASSPARAPLPPEPVLELTAAAELPRLVRDPRTVAVLVTNHGTEPVWVREVELLTDSFDPTAPVRKGVVIQVGAAKALTVVPGEARCGGEPAPPLARATARLVVAAGAAEPAGDRWQAVELPLARADDRLARRLRADCTARFVAEAAGVRLEQWAPAPDGRLRGALVVERRGGDELLTVHDLTGSTLYTLITEHRGGEVGRLPPGEAHLEVPVLADAAQCGAHALADTKFPFGFRILITIGDQESLPAAVATDPAGQDQLRQMWHVRCGQ